MNALDALDRQLFLLLNAPADTSPWLLELALLLAVNAHWMLLALALGLALARAMASRGWRQLVRPLATAAVAVTLGSLASRALSLVWARPRPFVNGLGYLHLEHPPSASFPSSHATAYMALAFYFLLCTRYRMIGWGLLLLALLVGWARVFLGVHYPLDVLGAVPVAFAAAWVSRLLLGGGATR